MPSRKKSQEVATPSERAALMAEKFANAKGQAVPEDIAKQAGAVKEDLKAKDLSNPETQYRILNPELHELVLIMDDGRRIELELRTTFTLGDFRKAGVYEDLNALDRMALGNLMQTLPEAAKFENTDRAWFAKYGTFYDAALGQQNVQALARSIVAKMAKIKGDIPERLTVPMLEEGLDWTSTIVVTSVLRTILAREVTKRKNAIAARESAAV